MRRLVIVLVILLCLVSVAGAYWGLLGEWHWPGPEHPSTVAANVSTSEPSRTAEDGPSKEESSAKTRTDSFPPERSDSPFDVAKIDPHGPSVFAGRAQPNGHVTVFADGKPVGSANTDEDGEWVLIAEGGITSDDPRLTVEFSAGPVVKNGHVASSAVSPQVKQNKNEASSPESDQTAAKVTAELVGKLRRLVDRERTQHIATNTKPTAGTPTLSSDASQLASVGAAPAVGETVSKAADKQALNAEALHSEEVITDSEPRLALSKADGPQEETKSVPVPIKFVFNQAVLTDAGRETAELLVEYVMLKKYSSLELTGHADERGRHEYNLALSSERLDAVAAMLRKAGYSGKLRLIPKGETEPFRGVDRSKFSQDVLYELDRRVELREARP